MNDRFTTVTRRRARPDEARLCLALAVAAIVLGGALRIVLAGYSPWFDEYASIFFADQPLARLWSDWMLRETNPPLFYSLLGLWRQLVGDSAAGMRLLSIAAGVGGLAVVTGYCHRWYGPRAALAAALLGAVSAQHIFYSEQLRAYILEFGAVAVALAGLTLLVAAPERRRTGAAIYAAGSLVAIYCHTTMFLWPAIASIAALATALTTRAPLRPLLLWLVAADLVIAAGSAWWLHVTLVQLHSPNKNISWLEKAPGLAGYEFLISRTALLSRDGLEGISRLAVHAGLLLTLAAIPFTWRNPVTRLVAIIFALAVVLFDAASIVHPIAVDRTVFWMTLFPLILLAGGIGAIRDKRIGLAVGGGFLALLVANLVDAAPRFGIEPWAPTFRQVAADPHGVLLVEGDAMGVVAPAACRVALGGTCPVRIAVLRSQAEADGWADGLGGPLIAPAALAAAVQPDAHVYLLKRGVYDPAASLGLMRHQLKPTFELRGPFDPVQLAAR